MHNFGNFLVKQRQLPDQQVDSGPWLVQLSKNDSGLNSHSGWQLTPSHVWSIDHVYGNCVEFVTHFNSSSSTTSRDGPV